MSGAHFSLRHGPESEPYVAPIDMSKSHLVASIKAFDFDPRVERRLLWSFEFVESEPEGLAQLASDGLFDPLRVEGSGIDLEIDHWKNAEGKCKVISYQEGPILPGSPGPFLYWNEE